MCHNMISQENGSKVISMCSEPKQVEQGIESEMSHVVNSQENGVNIVQDNNMKRGFHLQPLCTHE